MLAATEAEETLSPTLMREHWMRAKHGPNGWQEMSDCYPTEPALNDLAEINLCRNRLDGILLRAQKRERPPDLRLTRMRGTP